MAGQAPGSAEWVICVLAEFGYPDQELSWEVPPTSLPNLPPVQPSPCLWLAVHLSGITAVTSQLPVLLATEL